MRYSIVPSLLFENGWEVMETGTLAALGPPHPARPASHMQAHAGTHTTRMRTRNTTRPTCFSAKARQIKPEASEKARMDFRSILSPEHPKGQSSCGGALDPFGLASNLSVRSAVWPAPPQQWLQLGGFSRQVWTHRTPCDYGRISPIVPARRQTERLCRWQIEALLVAG
jgi:hypothetical protein